MISIKRWVWAALLLAFFAAGVLLTRWWYVKDVPSPQEQSVILLEQIKKVSKLVTVEGHYVEYYDYKEPTDSWYYALLGKDVRVRVRGRVLVGYDLNGLKWEADPGTKTIRFSGLSKPGILSIEHSVDQFDDQSSIFRPLSSADYVRIDKGVKEKLRISAENSQLIKAAQEQGLELLHLMEFMVTNAGWRFEYPEELRPAVIDSVKRG